MPILNSPDICGEEPGDQPEVRVRPYRGVAVDRRGMRVGVATSVQGARVASWLSNSSRAPVAICRNGTRTVVRGTGSLLTTGMSLLRLLYCSPTMELGVDISELGITFVRPDRRDKSRRHGNLALVRQRIESIINTTKAQLSLEQHGARTPTGVLARTAQRLLALAAAI